MTPGYRIVICGVQPGRSEEEVAAGLAPRLKHPAEQLVPVLRARRAINLNVTEAPLEVARGLKATYDGLGAECTLESLAPPPPALAPAGAGSEPPRFGNEPLRAFVHAGVGLALQAPVAWRDESEEGLLRVAHQGASTWFTASLNRAPGVDLGVWSEIRFSVLAEKMAYLKPYRAPYSLATAAGPAIAAEFRGLVPGDADPTHQLVLCLRPLVGAVSLSITSSIADFERHQALYLWLLQTQLRLHAGPAPAPDATHPHPQAQHDAGMKLARQGNPQEAMAWFRRAAEQGHARAQFDLARGYRLGEGVAQDMRQSFAWLHKAAQQGLALAQYNLAIMYGVGSGTAQDPAQAFHWLHKAAEQGEADAQYKVALSYIQGSGVPKSLAQAGPWALKAAQQGHADAQFYAGMMHESGGGLPEDMPRAIEWYRKAAAQRHGQAAERLKALGV